MIENQRIWSTYQQIIHEMLYFLLFTISYHNYYFKQAERVLIKRLKHNITKFKVTYIRQTRIHHSTQHNLSL